ncbi:MAG: MBL fold metallo-hydrolase [Deltaproteobacteria bacterium]|nr:MBL fold metallo-hydrolase [Deltaproteobacteria bacterium]
MSEVVFIGTSDAFGSGGRRQSATLVRGPNGAFLLDCGMTTGTGLCELGIERNEIDTILVSHFHADHFGGIPPFMLASLYEDGRRHPLRIAGPPGIRDWVHNLAGAMGYAMEDRHWPFEISFDELPLGAPKEIGPVRTYAFETHHQPHTFPHGIICETGAHRIAYSGDTGWFDDLPRLVAGSDLFISECTNHVNGFEYHLSHEVLVEKKSQFDCGRILLTHLGSEMANRRGNCDFETADDGLVVKL